MMPTDPASVAIIFMAFLWLWALLPIALFCIGSEHPFANAMGALFAAGFGVIGYLHTFFFAQPDALNGLVFLILPILQLGLVVIWRAVLWIVP